MAREGRDGGHPWGQGMITGAGARELGRAGLAPRLFASGYGSGTRTIVPDAMTRPVREGCPGCKAHLPPRA